VLACLAGLSGRRPRRRRLRWLNSSGRGARAGKRGAGSMVLLNRCRTCESLRAVGANASATILSTRRGGAVCLVSSSAIGEMMTLQRPAGSMTL
jgi:hypothetical protein